MKTRSILALLLAGLLLLSGCSADPDAVSAADAAVSDTTAEAAEPAPEPAPENYVHGEDGYFCLADELDGFQMRMQDGGTCWLCAASACMETAYARENGEYISIEPNDLLDVVYINDKEEGFFVDKGVSEKDIGGWQWMVTETLSRGFGDLALDSSVIIDPADRDAIKENVRTRGGVAVGTIDNPLKQGFFAGYHTMNSPTGVLFDHDVTVIGWDDHFPKQYFKESAAEDGAWICYNSASVSAGLYYISYCSPFAEATSHTAADRYSDVLSYDAGNEMDRFIKTGSATTTANVFHKSGTLAAVGTYNDFDRQNITIEIYDDTFTELLYSQTAVLDYHGYHTVELDAPVEVRDFAIAVTYSEGAPVEGEYIDYGEFDYITVSEGGQSFVKLDTWRDLTDSDIPSALGVDFAPGNACIKALYK